LLEDIESTDDEEELKELIARARMFFNITYGHGVLDSQHPGDMFGAPIDVNHVNLDSAYGPPNYYKYVFKRSEELRQQTNKTIDEAEDTSKLVFDESYMTTSLFNAAQFGVAEYDLEKGEDDDTRKNEIKFMKSRGIGRRNSKKLLDRQEDDPTDPRGAPWFRR
jgi:hypothetical protein